MLNRKMLTGIAMLFICITSFAQSGLQNALDFDGVNDHVTATTKSQYNFMTGTVECWVKPENLSGNACIVAMRSATQTRFSLHMSATTLGLYNGSNYLAVPFASISGQWYHLAFLIQTTKTDVYVNGVFLSTISLGMGTAAVNLPLSIGAPFPGASGEFFKGAIDEVRLWNGIIGAPTIVANMFTSMATNSSIVAMYHFNSGVAGGSNAAINTAADASSVANTATLNNFALTGSTSNWVGSVGSVTAAAPVVSSFTPEAGPVGTSVTITGSGFNTTASNNIVYFGATKASVTTASANSLTVTVPAGATWQLFSVLNTGTGLTGYSQKNFNTTFSGGAISFSGAQNHPNPGAPNSLTYSDIDDDGKADMITTDDAGIVSVYRNIAVAGTVNGSSFATRADFTASSYPGNAVAADFDGDGKNDLAVSHRGNQTLYVYRNTSTSGNISFAAPVSVGLSYYAAGIKITAADMDNDGRVEMIVMGTNGFSISQNLSSPGSLLFAPSIGINVGSSTNDYAVNDIDRDGRQDIVILIHNLSVMSVYRNTSTAGAISLAAKQDISVPEMPYTMASGDLDADGKTDLAVGTLSNNVFVYRNNSSSGAISLVKSATFEIGTITTDLAIGDVDGDGKPEILSGNSEYWNVSIYKNNTTAGVIDASSFVPASSINLTGDAAVMALADIDGDGKTDITAVTVYNDWMESYYYLSFFRNQSIPPPPPTITSFTPATGAAGTPVIISGANFSNILANNIVYFGATKAVVTAASTTSLTVTVPEGATSEQISVLNTSTALTGYSKTLYIPTFVGGATLSFSEKTDYSPGTNPSSLVIKDLDGDGKSDLVTSNMVSSTLSIFKNISNSTISLDTKSDINSGASPVNNASGDIDGDGKLDVAVTTLGGINIYLNNSTSGTPSLQLKTTIPSVEGPEVVRIADLDKDGKPDMVVANLWEGVVYIHKNTSTPGNAGFAPAQLLADGLWVQNILLGDIDQDGLPEILITESASVSIYRNTSVAGIISFTYASDIADLNAPFGLALGDLDGDGKADLVAGTYANVFYMLRNTSSSGSISFEPRINQIAGYAPKKVSLGDLDGDGKLDIAAVDAAGEHLYLFRNTSTSGNITLATPQSYATGEAPEEAVISDLNNDGKPDIALVNQYSHTMSIYTNMNVSGPLPVQWLSFTAKKQNNRVELNWSTSSEINADRFEVEKSTDGTSFTKIGTVNAKGSTNFKQDYTAFDQDPSVGKNFYRLKQIDKDGRFEYSKVITINWQSAVTVSVKLAPQPMQQLITITISGGEDNSSFMIYDISGNAVKSYKANTATILTIDRTGLSAGIYFYKLVSPKGAVLNKGKIIVQ